MSAASAQAYLSSACVASGCLRFQPFDKLRPAGYHPRHARSYSDGAFARRLAARRETRAHAPPLGVSPSLSPCFASAAQAARRPHADRLRHGGPGAHLWPRQRQSAFAEASADRAGDERRAVKYWGQTPFECGAIINNSTQPDRSPPPVTFC
jgi:hypothetical protein